ncbi:MAG: adenylate/guanylate cyclase domain-containing protein [Pyrinomonadaceae bacterium]
MALREYHYRWTFQLKANPEKLWPFVADTNRFNRDTGVPAVDVLRDKERLPNARRRLRLSIAGVPVEWEEQPFEWIRPEKFGVERTYSKGPMARMKVLVELKPRLDGGTELTYTVWATSRNVLGAIAIPLQVGLISARQFRKVVQSYDTDAISEPRAPLKKSASAAKVNRPRLLHLKERIVTGDSADPIAVRIVDRLASFIELADDLAVARIRPYVLADDWQESRRKVLEMCLRATRAGLLDLQWELLCPLCRGPQEAATSLKAIQSNVHCETCRIDFTANFDRFVELTFRPNAAIRPVDAKDYCIGSPERTPHVVAQQLLAGKSSRLLELPLETGNYRLRALELPAVRSITVCADGPASATLTINETESIGEVVRLAERSQVRLRNDTTNEQLMLLERTSWSDQAATASEVTALQIFRDLFSTEALRPGEQISVGTLTVLFTDLRNSTRLYREIGDATAFGHVMNHFDVLRKTITEQDGAIVKTIGDAVMAVFRNPANALRAMLDAQTILANPSAGKMPLTLKAGLHSGPCIAVTLNDRLDYFGSTVNLAARLECLSTGDDVIISRAVHEDTDVRQFLLQKEYEALPFDMSLKGFDEERFDLWRVRKMRERISEN